MSQWGFGLGGVETSGSGPVVATRGLSPISTPSVVSKTKVYVVEIYHGSGFRKRLVGPVVLTPGVTVVHVFWSPSRPKRTEGPT